MRFFIQNLLWPTVILVVFLLAVSCSQAARQVYFKTLPGKFNDLFKWFDHRINGSAAFEQKGWFSSAGHSPALSIVVGVVLLFTLFGPSLSPVLGWLTTENLSIADRAWGTGTLLLFFVLLATLGYFSRRVAYGNLRILHTTIIAFAALFTLFVIPAEHTEASGLPYRHAVAAGSVILVLVGIFAAGAVRLLSFGELFSDRHKAISRRALARRLLEGSDISKLDDGAAQEIDEEGTGGGGDSGVSASEVLDALVTVPFREPVLLLLFPALSIVIPFSRVNVETTAFAILLFTWLILASGMYFRKSNMMITLIHRRFARGGSFAISLLVIVIGICHLMNISYIRTVTDSDSWVLTLNVVAGYFIVWLYDYWANRVLSTEILTLFQKEGGKKRKKGWRVKFETGDKRQWILQLHGRSRLMVVPEDGSRSPMQEAVIAPDFMMALASAAPDVDKRSALSLAKDVTRLNKNHLILLHTVLAVTMFVIVLYLINIPPRPLVSDITGIMSIVPDKDKTPRKTNCDEAGDKQRLACRLSRAGENGPVILLAASGGGTRAALYTASVLNGLQRLGQLDQLVLASGVSGGGVALAYLAGNYPALAKAGPVESCDLEEQDVGGPWADFCRAMAAPYIQDVISGSAEFRVVGKQSIGVLLKESFERHFGPGGKMTLSQIMEGPALILNTTLAGHPRDASEALHRQFCPDSDAPAMPHEGCPNLERTAYTTHAGGRLVFTNLRGPVRNFSSPSDSFPSPWSRKVPDAHLKYIVVNDCAVQLVEAAALTANFPPVFSNAGVEISKGRPKEGIFPGVYWVTDGGVADNRGVISLLYALRVAVREMKYSDIKIPDIHVIVAEASAGTIDYSNSRGLSVVLGSSAPFASQLMIELVSDIEEITLAEVNMHYLAMPRMFVSRGGVGTHWMMPESAKFIDPAQENIRTGPLPDSVTLNKNEIVKLMFSIHDNQLCSEHQSMQYRKILVKDAPDPGESKHARSRDEWICTDAHQAEWARISETFRSTGEDQRQVAAINTTPQPARKDN